MTELDPTRALEACAAGRGNAADALLPLVYDQLRHLAGRYLRKERADHTLCPTDLVHEAYVRLVDADRVSWQGKTHFFAVSATQMRRILVEHARARNTAKRGGGAGRVPLHDSITPAGETALDVLALDEALQRLSELSPPQARIVELRFFGGLTVRETAYLLSISQDSVKSHWRMARAWLLRELSQTTES